MLIQLVALSIETDANGDGAGFAIRDTVGACGTDNAPPVANNGAMDADTGMATPLTLTGSDPEGQALTYRVVAAPTHGSLSGTAPNLTYTSIAGYVGAGHFDFCGQRWHRGQRPGFDQHHRQ